MSIRPFVISVPASDVDDLRRRLRETRWPISMPGIGWNMGMDADYLHALMAYWRDEFDWRSIEAALNDQGVALGRAALVQDLLAQGHLVAPFKRRVKSPVKYWLVYPKEARERVELQAVIGWLREEIRGLSHGHARSA